MCDPLTLASVAAQGVGAMVQANAGRRRDEARKGYIDADQQRRIARENEARGAIDKTTGMFGQDQFVPGMSNETTRLATLYDDATNRNIMSTNPSGVGVPQLIADTNKMEMDKAIADTIKQNNNLAKLNSFGDFLSNRINPQMNESALTSQMMGHFIRGDANALETELDAANRKAYSPLAQALMAGGRVGTSYGLMKKA